MENIDGINCINIYSKGETALGRSLSNFSDCNINISLGYFRTIEGLIFYLQSFDERFRILNGPECKNLSKQLDRTKVIIPENIFKRFIIEAMYSKINTDPDLKCAIKDSELKFVHYYSYFGNKIYIPEWDWQIQIWEKIRKELKDKELY